MFAGWLKDQIIARGHGELSGEEIMRLFTDDEIDRFMEAYQAELDEERYGKFRNYFRDDYRRVGSTEYFARDGYPRHLELFEAGATWRERLFMAGNRVGKTVAGAFETTAHLTGRYPHWWKGRRFKHPIKAYACGKTNETTRDIVQKELMGEVSFQGRVKQVDGTGIIPRECIGTGISYLTWKQGVADLIDTVKIKHVSGGWSKLGFKSYQQGRGAFEGTAQHLIWADEEMDSSVYGEMVIRTMTTNGIILVTFTPLEGLTDTVISFLPEDQRPAT